MKDIDLYQVDAFTTDLFGGNPAAVCPLDAWLDDAVLLSLAAENNLSETAFFVPDDTGEADYHLRWFTPATEIALCGHATLATAWVLFFERGFAGAQIRFTTQSGILTVAQGTDGELAMDFPANPVMPAPHPDDLPKALGQPAREFWRAKNDMLVAVLDSAEQVRALQPNVSAVHRMGGHGLIVTAAGGGADDDVDFVSRFFAPQVGIAEDPVTGSAHTVLGPYWAKRLKKDRLAARQVSARGGEMTVEIVGKRVRLGGRAVLYLKGTARVPAGG